MKISAATAAFCLLICASCATGAAANDDHQVCEGQDPETRIIACSRIIGDSPVALKDLSFVLNNRGVGFAELGNSHLAIADFSMAIRLSPKYADAIDNRGTVYFAIDATGKALTDFTTAIGLRPKHASTYSKRALVFFVSNQPAKALVDLNRAIKIDPRNGNYFSNRGLVHQHLGKKQAAIADYRKALELDPDLTDAKENLEQLTPSARAHPQPHVPKSAIASELRFPRTYRLATLKK